MSATTDVQVYFNFRSPYCYLASKKMFDLVDSHGARFVWRPLGGWAGRSPPERAKYKLPIVRQDVKRWCKRLGIPFKPPPITTDPTIAGAGSLLAEEHGKLREYVVAVMAKEWAEGADIGDTDILLAVGESIGLDRQELADAIQDPARLAQLERNHEEAADKGAFGVPTFIVGDEVFWGQDRIDFVAELLDQIHRRQEE
ncbi:MAG: 2-hydroxychromene-2-carboxylate isomerase [Chromatiales bacterium]|jgi:2-hydroxychromene-2-carboxylate isomerase|nr:2-hydroxychromene-2-carboxylate isomerase [Chromatiales bacterium]